MDGTPVKIDPQRSPILANIVLLIAGLVIVIVILAIVVFGYLILTGKAQVHVQQQYGSLNGTTSCSTESGFYCGMALIGSPFNGNGTISFPFGQRFTTLMQKVTFACTTNNSASPPPEAEFESSWANYADTAPKGEIWQLQGNSPTYEVTINCFDQEGSEIHSTSSGQFTGYIWINYTIVPNYAGPASERPSNTTTTAQAAEFTVQTS